MKNLNEVRWGNMSFEDLFEIKSGIRLTKDDMIEGSTPFVGATDSNNGITAFCGNVNKSLDSNCLGVNYNGSVVENFYHPYSAVFSDDVKRLHLRGHKGNKYIYLFLKNLILKQKDKYQYGYKFNGERMLKQILRVPLDENDKPDYTFMEQYMKALESKILYRYKTYLEISKRNPLDFNDLTGGGKFKPFKIEKVCEIVSGRDIYDRERFSGQNPYITATALNNGVGYFVGNKNESLESGCLSVNRNGSVGYSFYHPYTALYGNDTRKLRPYNKNRYVCFFLSRAITNQKNKFSYGLKLGTDRLKKQCIMLPATPDGEPDYTYMENYMRAKESEILQRYIKTRLSNV